MEWLLIATALLAFACGRKSKQVKALAAVALIGLGAPCVVRAAVAGTQATISSSPPAYGCAMTLDRFRYLFGKAGVYANAGKPGRVYDVAGKDLEQPGKLTDAEELDIRQHCLLIPGGTKVDVLMHATIFLKTDSGTEAQVDDAVLIHVYGERDSLWVFPQGVVKP
jgi:hypothetical protein